MNRWRLRATLIVVMGTAACDISTELPAGRVTFPSRGVVAGVVRDASGQPVAGTALSVHGLYYDAFGTPVLMAGAGSTNSSGSYLVQLVLTYATEVRAALSVRADPPAGSGLLHRDTSGLEVLVTSTLPPAETTFVNLVLVPTPPSSAVPKGLRR